MVFYILFALVLIAIFLLLLKGGAHDKIVDGAEKFKEETLNEKVKGNVENE